MSAESRATKILNRFWNIRQSDTPEEAFAFVLSLMKAAEKEAYDKGFAAGRKEGYQNAKDDFNIHD